MDNHHIQNKLTVHLASVPVVPVLTVHNPDDAADLAKALVNGGLHVLEVTLRTEAAFDVIESMTQVEGAVVGAGTLLTKSDVTQSVSAGAAFGVSPGSTEEIFDACEDTGLALLPGTDNVTTAMNNLAKGYRCQKFFPAEQSGGAAKLRAIFSPLPQISFCPTGGVSASNVAEYLKLPNVCCVGGSWVAPTSQVAAKQWSTIEETATKASSLNHSPSW